MHARIPFIYQGISFRGEVRRYYWLMIVDFPPEFSPRTFDALCPRHDAILGSRGEPSVYVAIGPATLQSDRLNIFPAVGLFMELDQ